MSNNLPVLVTLVSKSRDDIGPLQVVKKMGGIKGLFKGGNMNQQVGPGSLLKANTHRKPMPP